MVELAVAALQLAGMRAVILGGCAKLSFAVLEEAVGTEDRRGLCAYAREAVFFVDSAPHEWLFGRVQCAVHHGGAGTTAASLRSGRPTIVTPVFGDQIQHSIWVEKLGAGVATPLLSQLSAKEL